MSEVSDLTFCIVDGGMFVDLATRMAEEAGRVLYKCTISDPFPKIHEAYVGRGLEGVEVIESFWKIKKEIDCFIFPDCCDAELQQELVSQGFPVWGGRGGVELERDRLWFKDVLKSVGLPVGHYEVIMGLTNLRLFLAEKSDKFIKISKYRGCMETKRWVNQETSGDILDEFATMFGGIQEFVEFIVEDKIETKIEWGLDTYFCGGKFPSIVMHGPETKDKTYAGAVVEWGELPEEIQMVAEAMIPVLTEVGYAGMISMEVRIDEEGTPFFTDSTNRFPTPAGESQMKIYGNLPEIIYAGALGECIDPETTDNFAVQAMIDHTKDETNWRRVMIDEEARPWTNLYASCHVNPWYDIPPFPHSFPTIGSIVGTGSSMKEAIEMLKEIDKMFSDQPVSIHTDDLSDTLQEIHFADKKGIEFTDKRVPEPAIVLNSD